MVLNGSSGEKYKIDKKRKNEYGQYTDYSVLGSGGYCARVYNLRNRKHIMETQIKSAVVSGDYIDGEKPLNVLYLGKRFAGFLYEGELAEDYVIQETEQAVRKEATAFLTVGWTGLLARVVVGAVMALLGIFLIYPLAVQYGLRDGYSGLGEMVTVLNYKGIPAVIAGIACQIIVYIKAKSYIDNVVLEVVVAVLANLVGIVVWTVLVLFLARFIVVLILIAGGIQWLRSRGRRFRK